MGWRETLVGGLILVIVLLSLATSFTGYLVATHQTCASATASSSSSSSSSEVFASNSTGLGNASLAALPLPAVADDLVLSPLATLSLPQGNATSLSYLTNATYWGEVDASELQAYEQLVPQTVLGFLNSSQEWRAWALQYIPDPPAWLAGGVVAAAQAQAMGVGPSAGGNSSAVEQSVRGFAASAAGVSLAALDFVSFNGLTAYQTLVATNNPIEAACQTLPGQLAQLYDSSFDSTVPQAERADYLGRAIAITSVMLLLGGADGFAAHLRIGLDNAGLGDAWSTVKPYLGDIGSKASASASSATLAVLQALAQRFPQDSAFVTGFTADRVDSMVDVLEKKGVSNDVIQGDIGQVAQAAGSSSDETGAGNEADVLSLQQGGGIRVHVEKGGDLARYDGSGETIPLTGDLLQQVLPGFDPRGPEFVQIHYKEAGLTVYQYYQSKEVPIGGPYSPAETNWYPVAPDDVAQPGQDVTVSFDLLTPDEFISSVPPIDYTNTGGARWVSDFSEISSFRLVGGQVQMNVEQETLEGVSSFSVGGAPGDLSYSNGNTFITFDLPNVVGPIRTFKITFDGYGNALLSISSSSNFYPVNLVCSDGVRLRIVSDAGGGSLTVSTLYLQKPSTIYELGAEGQLDFSVPGASQTFVIQQVTPLRALENSMVQTGSPYALGRIGAEIAYTVVEQKFDVDNLIMNEPSQGGADLISGDRTVTVQARMLRDSTSLAPSELATTLSTEMGKLVAKIQKGDFANNSSAQVGYAVLSYLNPMTNQVTTIAAIVPRALP